MERAAGGLKQTGPRSLGFQKPLEPAPSNGDIHPRSTTHTKPFLPLTAVSYPCRPRTRISASREIASGAALRARAISAFRSVIRYWSSGAMLGYGVLASCACACHTVLSTSSSAKLPSAIVLTIFRSIDFPSQCFGVVDDTHPAASDLPLAVVFVRSIDIVYIDSTGG